VLAALPPERTRAFGESVAGARAFGKDVEEWLRLDSSVGEGFREDRADHNYKACMKASAMGGRLVRRRYNDHAMMWAESAMATRVFVCCAGTAGCELNWPPFRPDRFEPNTEA
jgi:hypothetical protein